MSLKELIDRVESVESDAGREVGSTRIIAVSKLQPSERIHAALTQGHRLFGENRVQEASAKWPNFRTEFSGVSVHLIGPLQSNKAKQAMTGFDAIHSLHSLKLARRIAAIAQDIGSCPDLFVQINTGEEPQKSGIVPGDADRLIEQAKRLDLPIVGLMCIPPTTEEPALHFALLAKIAARNGLRFLSMGMSNDFETAIRLGATHIRVGTAIFGTRPEHNAN